MWFDRLASNSVKYSEKLSFLNEKGNLSLCFEYLIFELKFASNEIFGLSLTFKSPSLILKNDETPLKSLISKSVLSAKKENFAFSKFKFFTISVLKLVTFPFVIKLSIEFF